MAAPKHILVTGGAGFIGSHVVEALVAVGHDVRILDRVAARNPSAEVVVGDIRDPTVTARAVAGIDAVCHHAAKVGLERGGSDMADYVSDNDLGTAVLLGALFDRAFEGPLVLAGSMVVYGESPYQCAEHGRVRPGPRRAEDLALGQFEPRCPRCDADLAPTTVSEDDAVDPRSVYAATKLHQEHLCTVFSRHSGAPVTALRYHNVYGPRMPADTPYAGVAALFRAALARGERPRVFEDGGQRRDFVHVADVARANVAAVRALSDSATVGSVPAALNIASGEPHTVGEMALAMAAAVPGDLSPAVTGEWRLGDVRHIVASADRAAEELGFRAQVPFVDGMAELAAEAS